MSSNQSRRLIPPLWLVLILILLGAVVGWLQFSDGAGDIGMNNVFSYMAVILGAVLYGLWFLIGSGQSFKCKFGSLFAVAAVGALVVGTVRLEGWSGSMLPVFHFVWETPQERLVGASGEVAAATGVDLASRTPADFPGFLGLRRDGIVRGVTLTTDWEATAPQILWRIPIGLGWSGFAVVNGVAVTHEEQGGEEHVVARDAITGAELWRYSYAASFDHPLAGPGPHATPTIDEGFVYTQGSTGVLSCLDGGDGSLVWQKDLRALYGATDEIEAATVQYGRSGSALVVGEALVIPAGGDPDGKHPGLVAFDKRSGELLWEGPGRAISHASPTIATLGGMEQILVVNEDTASAHDPRDGSLLWEHSWPGSTAADASNSQPMAVSGSQVLLSKGYGKGSMLLDVSRNEGGQWNTDVRWNQRRSLRTKLTNAVWREGYAYGLSDGMLECVSLEDGKRVWKDGRFGHGQLLLVDELLLLLSEEGELLLIPATPEGEGRVLGRFSVLEGKTWNTIALYGDLALVRNGQEAAAVRLPTLGG